MSDSSSPAAPGPNAIFAGGAGGAPAPDPAQNAGGTTTGLTANGALDAAGLAFGPNSTVGYKGSAAAGIPAMSNGSPAANIALLGNYMASSLTTGGNGLGITAVADPTKIAPPPLIANTAGHHA